MLVLELRFPAGRYHGTAWGRHVNEGVPEWPPSPYRLVRGLFDAWKRKRPEWSVERVRPLLSALASEPPSFLLPPATAAHTRSFLDRNTGDPSERTLIFDAFVAVDRESVEGSVVAVWPNTELDAGARLDLDDLLGAMNYLGRSESWVIARLAGEHSPVRANCGPAHRNGLSGDLVPVACAIPEAEFKGRDWISALSFSTSDLLKKKVSAPPAMQYVEYVRPFDCFVVPPRRTIRPRLVNMVELQLDSKVLPLVTATLDVAQLVRASLMRQHQDVVGTKARVSARFSGKEADGTPRRDHGHVYILPWDKNGDGRLDHVTIWTREQFDRWEVEAINRLAELRMRDRSTPITCIPVLWALREQDAARTPRARSVSPFVPPRHWRKGRGEVSEWLISEVARECGYQGLPAPVRLRFVERLSLRGREFRWLEFKRSRKGDEPRVGFGLELEFNESVPVPFAIGYGSHFGLGQFRDDDMR